MFLYFRSGEIMNYILFNFMLFFIYSIVGWCIEMVVCSIQTKKIVNRGFLVGPYCPVYGISAMLMIYLLKKYLNDPLVLFIMSTIICSITEYITSLLMEKLFHARWWDYSKIPFNLNGRVCLLNSICFGFLGLFLMYILNPSILFLLNHINYIFFTIVSIIFTLIFIADVITSFKIIHKMKITVDNLKKDRTEEITRKVKSILLSKSILTKRLIQAFPNIKFKSPFKNKRK